MYFDRLNRYKDFMENGTHEGQDYSLLGLSKPPLGRYHTIEYALTNFANYMHRTIVELGTIRSYVNGNHPDCNTDNKNAWNENVFDNWDWGAGCFSLVAADALQSVAAGFIIHTVDLIPQHMQRCRVMTHRFQRYFRYHVCDTAHYLSGHPGKIDLLYMDTGDMSPFDAMTALTLNEAKVVVTRNLMSPEGLIVIDDVKNTTALKLGETTSKLGKAKDVLPYLLENGFEVVMDEFQVVLRRK